MRPGTREGSSAGPGCCAGCSATWAYDPEDLVVLEVSVVYREAIWSLGKAPRGESQMKLLGLWSKARPSSADNYSPSERQLLACCWALVETGCLAMGHKVTTRPELPIMSRVLSDPPGHKVRMCTVEIHYQVEVVYAEQS